MHVLPYVLSFITIRGKELDIYTGGNRFSGYFLTMASLEVNQLMNTALAVSGFHIKDALTRMRFQDNVRDFGKYQLEAIRNGATEQECLLCIQNIREENNNLKIQDRMLRTGESVLTASVRIYEENGKYFGYAIDFIGVVISGLQVAGGIGVIASSVPVGNMLGIIAGATLVLNGVSSAAESVQKLAGKVSPINFMRDGFEGSAEFLGFDRKVGLLAYQMVDLSTSYYGMFKLTLKPDAWRLYRYLAPDFMRQVNTMSRTALAIKGAGATLKGAKIGHTLYQLQSNERTQ